MNNDKKTPSKKVAQEAKFTGNLHDFQFNSMSLPPGLKEELEKKDLDYRFINHKQLKHNGYHKSFWKPYKRDDSNEGESVSIYGNDPNGYIIRGDSILAVKPMKEAQAFRNALSKRNNLLARSASSKEVAKNMRDEFGEDLGDSAEIKDISEED